MIPSSLFKYELAIVAILKNEALYVKEWIDYHILAGIDHFYLYDNESTDNVKEILQPYIDNGLVTYEFYPGKIPQMAAYNSAIKKYRFEAEYLAFIDLDEFIYPHENKSILEIINEYFNKSSNIAGFSIHWATFGASGQYKADYSKGVLERFLHRAATTFNHNKYVKTIVNPRSVNHMQGPHNAMYFEGKFAVREDGAVVQLAGIEPVSSNIISINHYRTKSKEEYEIKADRGDAYYLKGYHNADDFDPNDPVTNEVYDDGILKYIEERKKLNIGNKILGGGGYNQINQRRFDALIKALSPFFWYANLSALKEPENIFSGKAITFLTCWTVSRDLKTGGLEEQDVKFFEELSLKCLHKSIIKDKIEVWQMQLLLEELPEILSCKYSIIEDIKEALKLLIPQFMEYRRMQNNWADYKLLEYIAQILNL